MIEMQASNFASCFLSFYFFMTVPLSHLCIFRRSICGWALVLGANFLLNDFHIIGCNAKTFSPLNHHSYDLIHIILYALISNASQISLERASPPYMSELKNISRRQMLQSFTNKHKLYRSHLANAIIHRHWSYRRKVQPSSCALTSKEGDVDAL